MRDTIVSTPAPHAHNNSHGRRNFHSGAHIFEKRLGSHASSKALPAPTETSNDLHTDGVEGAAAAGESDYDEAGTAQLKSQLWSRLKSQL